MAFCRNHIPFCLPSFPGPADPRQIHATMVRRHVQRMDNLHAYVPMPSSRRLPLCSYVKQVASQIPVHITRPSAHRLSDSTSLTEFLVGDGHFARNTLETVPRCRSIYAHHTHSCCRYRTAFHHSFLNQYTPAVMVLAAIPGQDTLWILHDIQYGIPARSAFLPAARRATVAS